MPVLPQAEATSSPSGFASAARSLMDRAVAARRQEYAFQQQQIMDKLQAPINEAKAQADIVKAGIDLDTAKRLEEQRAYAYKVKEAADNQFDNLVFIQDPEERANEAIKWAAQNSQLGIVKEFEPDIKQKQDLIAKMLDDAQKVRLLKQQQKGQQDLEAIKAQAKAEADAENAALRKEIEQMRTDRSKGVQDSMTERQTLKSESAGAVAQRQALGKATAEEVGAAITGVKGQQAILDNINRARELLDKGAAQGAGVKTLTDVANAANLVFPGLIDTTKEQALGNVYADIALRGAEKIKGQGQVTENERKMIADAAVKMGNTPEAARRIMDYMEAIAKREIQRGKEFASKVDRDGFVSRSDIAEYYEKNPLANFVAKESASPSNSSSTDIQKILDKYK
jgi:hypothetical protein